MIAIENLTKRYGNTKALKGVTLELSSNETLAILGPSGCGKTTLLRLIAGLDSPDEGRVLIDGVEASTPKQCVAPHRRGLSMIFQDLALWPHMTVWQHIAFVLKKDSLSRDALESRADKVLQNVNLDSYHKNYPAQLSGGEKQRLAIARAIASESKYLLMDEPFSSLDTILKEELQKLIIGLKKDLKLGIIYVSHNIEEVLVLADRIAVMNKGKLEQIDTKERVLNNPQDGFVRRLLRIK